MQSPWKLKTSNTCASSSLYVVSFCIHDSMFITYNPCLAQSFILTLDIISVIPLTSIIGVPSLSSCFYEVFNIFLPVHGIAQLFFYLYSP